MKRIKTAVYLLALIILLAATTLSDASVPAIVAANQATANQGQNEVNQTNGTVQSSGPQNSGQPKEEPKFEAVFAIAGLLAVAYLVLRRK